MGVLVLVVVLAIMAGFEREVKSRFLGFTPHVTLHFAPVGRIEPINEWRPLVERMKGIEAVVAASPQVRDFTLLEASGLIAPVEFNAIDTGDRQQMADL